MTISREQTNRRRVNTVLQTLSRVVEQAADGMFITDKAGVIQYANPAFEGLMAFPQGELIGQTPRLFRSGAHDDTFYRTLWDTILGGNVFRAVVIDRRGDGTTIHLDETIAPVRDAEGDITHFLAAARDVSEPVRSREALRRLNDSLEQQARRIAQALHDEAGQFLTSAHIALTDLGRDLPKEMQARLQEVTGHLDRVEDQLRRVAHELRPRILDDLGLVPALEFVTSSIQRRRGIAVTLDATLDRRLQPAIETTVYRFVQESLSNVSRHSHATRTVVRLEQRSRRLRCTVQDDGIGFDAAILNRPGDLGLGLTGIRDRVDALGGTLEIASVAGSGTLVTVTIPLEM